LEDVASLVPNPLALAEQLSEFGYVTDAGLATALFCAVRLPQPLLLEGEAGVGKTQAAKALAALLKVPLIRLQCFEGIDAAEALYEWNYPRQLLGIRLAESQGGLTENSLFSRDYLITRPIMQALEHPGPMPAVLLIDEIDRADEEFEAFLFEMLAESAVTIPELGTIRAQVPPVVILTSNRSRDLHDALKRRCLYHWIDYPDLDRAIRIVRMRVPEAPEPLVAQIAGAVEHLRRLPLQKPPGVAEAIDWVHAAELLGLNILDEGTAVATLGSVLKYREDQELVRTPGMSWLPDS
jgi:MoxR-like ATPase